MARQAFGIRATLHTPRRLGEYYTAQTPDGINFIYQGYDQFTILLPVEGEKQPRTLQYIRTLEQLGAYLDQPQYEQDEDEEEDEEEENDQPF